MTTQPHILGLTQPQLTEICTASGLQKFRAKQLWRQVMHRGVTDPAAMTDFSKADREKLPELINFTLPEIKIEQQSSDGTIKWLLTLADGHDVEMVFIPEEDRGTLCVSSQIGCTLTCRFCHTGTQGLSRNLEAHEIAAQVYIAKTRLGDWPADKTRRLTNIVFMGMGEPLYNMDNVAKACNIIMAADGIGLGSRRITISTSGMVENITRVGELGVNLAISLHAPDDETRTHIMPINNKWPLEELMAAIRAFPLKEHRRITFEYVMLDGVNDSDEHAKRLLKLIKGIPALINIIPFNPWPGSPFECSSKTRINAFANILEKAGVDVTVRKTRGEDILAACGQLRTQTSKFNTISLQFPSVVAQYGSDKQKTRIQIKDESTS